MTQLAPEEADRIAAARHGQRFLPNYDQASAEDISTFDDIATREEQAFAAATAGIDGAGTVYSNVRKATAAARAKADAFARIKDALPSDREELRRRAEAMDDGSRYYDQAITAAEVLGHEARRAAIPKPPKSSREYAQVSEELRMMLDSKLTKEHVLQLCKEERYAGLLAGDWGRAYFRSKGNGDYHDAVVALVTEGAGSKQSDAAKRLIAASRHADRNRLRAAGVKR